MTKNIHCRNETDTRIIQDNMRTWSLYMPPAESRNSTLKLGYLNESSLTQPAGADPRQKVGFLVNLKIEGTSANEGQNKVFKRNEGFYFPRSSLSVKKQVFNYLFSFLQTARLVVIYSFFMGLTSNGASSSGKGSRSCGFSRSGNVSGVSFSGLEAFFAGRAIGSASG